MNLSAFFALPAPMRLPPSWRRSWSSEGLLLAVSVFWLLSANDTFLHRALEGRLPTQPESWLFGSTLALAQVALHFLLLGLLCHGRALRPLLALLMLVAAGGAHFIDAFGVCLDASMLRNALGSLSVVEAGVVLVILFATAAAFLWLGVQLFRTGSIAYDRRLNIGKALGLGRKAA